LGGKGGKKAQETPQETTKFKKTRDYYTCIGPLLQGMMWGKSGVRLNKRAIVLKMWGKRACVALGQAVGFVNGVKHFQKRETSQKITGGSEDQTRPQEWKSATKPRSRRRKAEELTFRGGPPSQIILEMGDTNKKGENNLNWGNAGDGDNGWSREEKL